jgi:hypothetical protein
MHSIRYSFLLISYEFCDLSLLHWPLFSICRLQAPTGTRLTARSHFTESQKSLDFQGPTPQTCPRKGFAGAL